MEKRDAWPQVISLGMSDSGLKALSQSAFQLLTQLANSASEKAERVRERSREHRYESTCPFVHWLFLTPFSKYLSLSPPPPLFLLCTGIFIALMLRFDAKRADRHSKRDKSFPKPFFSVTLLGYFLGMVNTIVVMHYFQAAQVRPLSLLSALCSQNTTLILLLCYIHIFSILYMCV